MNQVYDEIVETIPHLRRYALRLCRNPTAADDLVQESIVRALTKSQLFTTGSNLRAWVFTIMHNVFVSSLRRGRQIELPMDPDMVAARIVVQPTQELTLEVNALIKAMKGIHESQRDAVLMAGYDGMTYENIAAHLSIPVGTIKSRVSRGRAALRVAMHG
jgi:RNA polymerase sigma-70 factor, ECF subfamily